MFLFLNKPWLHFILIGSCFFYINNAFFPDQQHLNRVSADEILSQRLFDQALENNFQASDKFIQQRIAKISKFLSTQKLNGGQENVPISDLYHNDQLIKNRLVQLQKNLSLEQMPATEISEDELIKAYQEKPVYSQPIWSFEHIFFSGDSINEQSIEQLFIEFKTTGVDEDKILPLSDIYLLGQSFADIGSEKIRAVFGNDFDRQLMQCKTSVWCYPLFSKDGMHLVKILETTPAKRLMLNDVGLRQQLLSELRQQAEKDFLYDLYGVIQ